MKIRDYYHYTRYEEGKEYPIFCRKKHSLDNPEEIMLDCNELAKGFAFFEIGEISLSEDDKLIAYSVDTVSRRIYTVYVKDLETGETHEETIPNTSGNVVWASDNQTLFYGVKDEALRPCKIFRHKLGTPHQDDVEVFHETDEAYYVSIGKRNQSNISSLNRNRRFRRKAGFWKATTPTAHSAYSRNASPTCCIPSVTTMIISSS